ncbi:hypothetical protein HPB51_004082 [Rhipicephalus microplus]|uniref:Uncharacterized protein n=1 Tax=Rhipicephalus microplus TaxID=6941 RepID=A0A9J6EF02_RHIMP|nr:hypothetical protein HPB51_004082 [Rhipicephalus microplus]
MARAGPSIVSRDVTRADSTSLVTHLWLPWKRSPNVGRCNHRGREKHEARWRQEAPGSEAKPGLMLAATPTLRACRAVCSSTRRVARATAARMAGLAEPRQQRLLGWPAPRIPLLLLLTALALGSPAESLPQQESSEEQRSDEYRGFQFKHHDNVELADELRRVSRACPDITNLYELGHRSVLGQPLWVLEMTDRPGVHELRK